MLGVHDAVPTPQAPTPRSSLLAHGPEPSHSASHTVACQAQTPPASQPWYWLLRQGGKPSPCPALLTFPHPVGRLQLGHFFPGAHVLALPSRLQASSCFDGASHLYWGAPPGQEIAGDGCSEGSSWRSVGSWLPLCLLGLLGPFQSVSRYRLGTCCVSGLALGAGSQRQQNRREFCPKGCSVHQTSLRS